MQDPFINFDHQPALNTGTLGRPLVQQQLFAGFNPAQDLQFPIPQDIVMHNTVGI